MFRSLSLLCSFLACLSSSWAVNSPDLYSHNNPAGGATVVPFILYLFLVTFGAMVIGLAGYVTIEACRKRR